MDVLEQYAGLILLVAGIALVSIPAALIVAGVLLAVHGTLRELNRKDEDGTRESDTGEPPAWDEAA